MAPERGALAPGSGVPAGSGRVGAFLLTPAFALLFVLLLALVWSLLPTWLQTVPHADNVEQVNWAHSLEWGYLKHPPLPTWLLRGATGVFGPSALLTNALAMSCVALTLLGLWRCAILLLDRQGALLVLLLSSANYYLMGRGSFLNHNTVMLPLVAASAWAVLRIVRDGAAAAWPVWLLLGLAQGLGMLTKYQMALVIAANLVSLLGLGAWRQPRFVAHAALAVLATLLPLLPHFLWLRQHDYSTFAYAGQSLLADLPAGQRLIHTLGFLLQQLGRFAPAIVAAGLALWWTRRAARPAATGQTRGLAPAPASGSEELRALALLTLTPIALIVALSLFAGVALQNHWGASSTLLLPLLAVVAWPRLRQVAVAPMLAAVLAAHALAAAWNVETAFRQPEFHYTFAARPLARMALAYWQEHTPGQLQIVIGPDWEAGAIGLELPSHPDVIASGERQQAPWVSDERIAQCGALVVWRTERPPQEQIGGVFAGRVQDPRQLQAQGGHGAVSTLEVGILAPAARGC
jgi:4-amino-4-deoxy-L-arabinose transferase-like glycosyltransferase